MQSALTSSAPVGPGWASSSRLEGTLDGVSFVTGCCLPWKTTSDTFRDKVPHFISDMPRASSFSFAGWGKLRCDGLCQFIQNHSKKDLTDHQPQQEDSAESQYAAELAAMLGPPPSEPSGSKAKDVFTFVRPVEYYSRLLKVAHSLGPVGTPETLLIIQTTGCPSCALAAVHTFVP